MALVVCAVLITIDATRTPTIEFLAKNWGNIASVAGFILSLYVLAVAKGARKAAEEAVSAERLRTVLEELADAADKCTHVGLYAQNEQWPLVNLRAAEVQMTCRSTVARWQGDDALKDSRSKLLQVATLMRSIVDETDNQPPNKKTILAAQRDSADKLAVVLGRMKQDSGSA